MTYNGWKNKETWLVNVWFGDGIEGPVSADEYESLVESCIELESFDGFTRDLLNCSWYEIDWHGLAKHTLDI